VLANAKCIETLNIMKSQKTEFTIVEWAREYCLVTGQHGYKFFALPSFTLLER